MALDLPPVQHMAKKHQSFVMPDHKHAFNGLTRCKLTRCKLHVTTFHRRSQALNDDTLEPGSRDTLNRPPNVKVRLGLTDVTRSGTGLVEPQAAISGHRL